jgi:hypothetical protein
METGHGLEQGFILHGMEEISEYARLGEKKIKHYIRQEAFPASCIDGAYRAVAGDIDAWWAERIRGAWRNPSTR